MPPPPPGRLRGGLVVFGVAALFLGFAAVVTLAAPVSTLTLTRSADGRVTATVRRYVLFAIPVWTETAADVRGVGREVAHPEPDRPDLPNDPQVRPEAVGELILTGTGPPLRVMANPEQLGELVRNTRAFLAGSESEARFTLVSSWLVGVYVPAIVALPGVLLIAGGLWDQLRPLWPRRRRR